MRTQRGACWGDAVVEAEVLGQPCLTFAERRRHLSELHLDARGFAHRPYLVQGDRRLAFADHERATMAVASFFRRQGVQRGDRVMLLGANTIEWVVTFWAAVHAEAIIVLGNAWWTRVEVEGALETVDATLIVGDEKRIGIVPRGPAQLLFPQVAELIGSAIEGETGGEEIDLTAREDDPAVVMFTSGTTGRPKGAVLTHRGLLATLQSLLLMTGRLPSRTAAVAPPSKALLSLPLFHIGGLQQILNPMVTGGTLVFSEGRFDPARTIDVLHREQINVWSAVPTMVSRVVDELEARGEPGPESVRTLGMGGSPVSAALRQRVAHAFPNVRRGLAVTYGLTEAGGVVSTGAGKAVLHRPGSVGKPLPVVSIRINNPDPDGTGEVLVRSPSLMLRYWGDGAAESIIDDDRWLYTGDLGHLDEDGYLYVTDRSKDMVIRGGENVASAQVEGRLLEHAGVQEAAVIGLPHPALGEEVAAIVVLRPGITLSEEELAAFVAQTLAYFAVPTRWWLRAAPLPKNPTGKIMKPALRSEWPA